VKFIVKRADNIGHSYLDYDQPIKGTILNRWLMATITNEQTFIRVTRRDTCRVSGSRLLPILNLGDIYLSDFLQSDEIPVTTYPLELMYSPASRLVQLRHTVNPDLMFRRYWYRSGTNEAMRAHLVGMVADIQERVELYTDDVVVDIGANDWTLLNAYPSTVMKWGFDPSDVYPERAMGNVVNDYFQADLYSGQPAKVVTAIAMFYDLDDPIAFCKDVESILADDGLFVIEMHYLPAMLANNGFDAICHEHLTYWSLQALEYTLTRANMFVQDVELNDVNGGSFRAYCRKLSFKGACTDKVAQLRSTERDTITFEDFGENIRRNREQMRLFLRANKINGKLVLGYGASTKGNTMLQYYGIDSDLLPAIADRNPDKWGLRTAGTNIPIISEDEARAMQPDYFLALPYHFIDAFIERESAFIARGGKFIVPTPKLRIVPE